VDPNATATDANSNEVYTNVTATTVSPSTCTPSNTAQCTFHGFLSRAAGYIPVPRLTHLSSAIGRASGGQSISISGTGFTGATTVTFGGSPAAGFTVNSDNSITATTPTMAPGSYDVTVTTLGGSNPAGPLDRFLFVALPSVVKISPQAGLVTGFTPVTITGVNLSLVSQVLFGGVPTGFTVNSDKSITATAPPTDGEAIIQVTVVSPGGTSASISATRFIYAPTTCSSSSPCESSVHCSKLTGVINGSMTASSCSPKSSLNSSATFTLVGSLKWSPGGRTTLAYIATPSSMGRGACAVGHVEESLAGAVVGGTSSYTSFGDSVYGLVCVSKSTHKVALLSGSKLLL
jgi:hypothetical protein